MMVDLNDISRQHTELIYQLTLFYIYLFLRLIKNIFLYLYGHCKATRDSKTYLTFDGEEEALVQITNKAG